MSLMIHRQRTAPLTRRIATLASNPHTAEAARVFEQLDAAGDAASGGDK
jgi:hypothetical protein